MCRKDLYGVKLRSRPALDSDVGDSRTTNICRLMNPAQEPAPNPYALLDNMLGADVGSAGG
ncbi:hypothetical protein CBOM_04885 [Ceraceosorus bombacis]|uniref:Uncharacterized protein n=1 Tax=Ceraceosorus bombacis TaxID=401625 RepID=A0A0P1BHV6_9BASI|nr:hypothetical protein CBOM_04885 [Ceraceosorus bombacis]